MTAKVELEPVDVTNEGNQNALTRFLYQATAALDTGDTQEAIKKLNDAIKRTDGCVLRGEPDGNGSGRDWITDCSAQIEAYDALTSALNALEGSQ